MKEGRVLTREETVNNLEYYASIQLHSARNMVRKIIDSLSKNEMSKETALELLESLKEQIASIYDQRLRALTYIKINTRTIEYAKADELKQLGEKISRLSENISINR